MPDQLFNALTTGSTHAHTHTHLDLPQTHQYVMRCEMMRVVVSPARAWATLKTGVHAGQSFAAPGNQPHHKYLQFSAVHEPSSSYPGHGAPRHTCTEHCTADDTDHKTYCYTWLEPACAHASPSAPVSSTGDNPGAGVVGRVSMEAGRQKLPALPATDVFSTGW